MTASNLFRGDTSEVVLEDALTKPLRKLRGVRSATRDPALVEDPVQADQADVVGRADAATDTSAS